MSKFYDKYGNLKPNSWDSQSENPTTFNVAKYFSEAYRSYFTPSAKVLDRIWSKYYTNNNEWRTMEEDPNPDWSHDEKISALAFFGANRVHKYALKSIPIFANPFRNSSWLSWLRPDVLAYSLRVKYPWFLPWLTEFVIYTKILISLKDFVKNPKGESSGMQKAFIMLMGLGDTETVKEINKNLVYKGFPEGWRAVFNIYYPEEDHPIRKVWNER